MPGSGKFYVLIRNEYDWFLKGTTWTSDYKRATIYPSAETAELALKAAHKWMKPAARKAAKIMEAEA